MPQDYYYYKSQGILAEKVNSQEELEYTSGSHLYRDKPTNKTWGIGINWHLNRNVKLAADF